MVVAGDQGIAFKDTPATKALMAFPASPEAAKILAAKGGFMSANKNLDPAAYPDATTWQLATSVVAELLRFDLSDLTPCGRLAADRVPTWVLLQDF